jgi:hypothetical protein
MQLAVSGGFQRAFHAPTFLLSLAWFALFAAAGLAIFGWRTRRRGGRSSAGQHPAAAWAT